MNELSNKYALAALRERRAVIGGEITQTEVRLRYLRRAVENIARALRLFDLNADPSKIKGKKLYRRVKLFGSVKLRRLVTDALRKGARPMHLSEIVACIVETLGYGLDTAKGITQRVRANLLYQTRVRGVVRKDGEREKARWALISSVDKTVKE